MASPSTSASPSSKGHCKIGDRDQEQADNEKQLVPGGGLGLEDGAQSQIKGTLSVEVESMEPGVKGVIEEEEEKGSSQLIDGHPGEVPKSADLVFPEEVWVVIFGNLKDPRDLWNCTNTCQLFEDVLRPWKTGWMFEQALPNLYRHLPRDKLLECRLISKGWYGAMDRFLEGHPSLQPHPEDRDHRVMDLVYPVKEKDIGNRNVYRFCHRIDEQAYLEAPNFQRMRMLGGSPFMGRSVILILGNNMADEDDHDQLWDKVVSFLEACGKHIWYLAVEFDFRSAFNQLGQSAWMVQKYFDFFTVKLPQCLPNLKRLTFDFNTCFGLYRDAFNPETVLVAPKLETLEGDRMTSGPAFRALLQRHHEQLRILTVSQEVWEWGGRLGWLWPNLVELNLFFNSDDDDICHYLSRSTTKLKAIRKLFRGVQMPQLRKLGLNLWGDYIEAGVLVGVVQYISTTTRLDTLRVNGMPEERKDVWKPLPTPGTAPPTLKTLELVAPWNVHSRSIPSLDFILHCFPLLENVKVILTRTYGLEDTLYPKDIDLLPMEECKAIADRLTSQVEVIEVSKYLYDGGMYKSKIWELLPRLKVFTFQWDVFTREGFEAYRQVRNGTVSSSERSPKY